MLPERNIYFQGFSSYQLGLQDFGEFIYFPKFQLMFS